MDTVTWVEKINSSGNLGAEEIKRSLRKAKYFAGIITISQLSELHINSLPVSFMVNFDSHWIAFFVSENTLEIFDSTSKIWKNPPKEFIKFICLHCSKHVHINNALQSNKTNICDLYVILFIKLKSRLWSWREIIDLFNCKRIINDSTVSKIFLNNIPKHRTR